MEHIIFITGGVRSGKSAFAERKAAQFGTDKQFYYVATGVAFDQEMQARIKRHQQDRMKQSLAWQTIEMSVEFPMDLNHAPSNAVILVECVTTWLSNVLYASENKPQRTHFIALQLERFQQQVLFWQAQQIQIIIVSNEILDEPPSIYGEVNLYSKLLGELHQWLVKQSDEAYEVQFQLVQRWK